MMGPPFCPTRQAGLGHAQERPIQAGLDQGRETATQETAQKTIQETTQEKILAILVAEPALTRKLLAQRLGITQDGVKDHLGKLRSAGTIRREGPDRGGRWEVLEKDEGDSRQNILREIAQDMLTGEVRNQIDRIWDAFWSGGISNPMEVIEQMTYLLFIKRLDELHTVREKKANRLKRPIEQPIFNDKQQDFRWSRFKSFGAPQKMYTTVADKVFPFIKGLNEDHIAIRKLKHNKALTLSDLAELERFLFESGEVQGREQFEKAFGNHDSLSLFIRSLVGLDRNAAKQAFAKYLDAAQFNITQIRFVEMIIDHLTQKGLMDAGVLYEQPFTGLHYEGLDGVFPSAVADEIVSIIELINANANISAAA